MWMKSFSLPTRNTRLCSFGSSNNPPQMKDESPLVASLNNTGEPECSIEFLLLFMDAGQDLAVYPLCVDEWIGIVWVGVHSCWSNLLSHDSISAFFDDRTIGAFPDWLGTSTALLLLALEKDTLPTFSAYLTKKERINWL